MRALCILALLSATVRTAHTQTTPSLAWDEDPASTVTGFAVTVDGVRTDYGLMPRQPDGTCGCSIPLPFSSGRHVVIVSAYNSGGETQSPPLIEGPTANAGGPYSGQAGTAVAVTGAATTDTTGTITNYSWNWGDGTTDTSSATATASHVYAAAGTFTITLTVTDDFPATSTATTTATIAAVVQPPGTPASPNPPSGATGVATNATLTWSSSGATNYDVRFGTTNPPPQVSAGQVASSYTPTSLANATTYYWQIVAHDSGGTTSGPVWSFSTVAASAGAPSSPNPADGATSVATNPTLTWIASGATSYDVLFGTTNPPPNVSSGQAAASYAPPTLTANTKYFWQIVANGSGGSTQGSVWSFTTGVGSTTSGDVVIYASDVQSYDLHGSWAAVSDATSPNAIKLATPDAGISQARSALASPTDYVEATFDANAGTPYAIWLRLQATGNSKSNDSVWVQFSDALVSGTQRFALDSTDGLLVALATNGSGKSISAWGWQNGAYWLTQPTAVTFSTTGSHTIRIQVREDGVQFDQIVLSPGTFMTSAPGGPTDDHTIVPKADAPPSTPTNASPFDGATGVSTTVTASWSSLGATSYDVNLGTMNPPPPAATGLTTASYTMSTLTYSTTYYWQIVAHNANGATPGPIWSFTTAASAPPARRNIAIDASDIPPSAPEVLLPVDVAQRFVRRPVR